jgi:hypothetical protein
VFACVQGQLLAYAGVGVVQGSEVAAEWQELNLKVGFKIGFSLNLRVGFRGSKVGFTGFSFNLKVGCGGGSRVAGAQP